MFAIFVSDVWLRYIRNKTKEENKNVCSAETAQIAAWCAHGLPKEQSSWTTGHEQQWTMRSASRKRAWPRHFAEPEVDVTSGICLHGYGGGPFSLNETTNSSLVAFQCLLPTLTASWNCVHVESLINETIRGTGQPLCRRPEPCMKIDRRIFVFGEMLPFTPRPLGSKRG